MIGIIFLKRLLAWLHILFNLFLFIVLVFINIFWFSGLGQSNSEYIDVSQKEYNLRRPFLLAGFARRAQGEHKLLPCPRGTYVKPTNMFVPSQINCIECPAGRSFLSWWQIILCLPQKRFKFYARTVLKLSHWIIMYRACVTHRPCTWALTTRVSPPGIWKVFSCSPILVACWMMIMTYSIIGLRPDMHVVKKLADLKLRQTLRIWRKWQIWRKLSKGFDEWVG